MLSTVMLSAIMLSANMLSAVILGVVAPFVMSASVQVCGMGKTCLSTRAENSAQVSFR
jgi:hypothetical protein